MSRLAYFTTNGYKPHGDGNNVGGWNRDVDGWVQHDSSIFPGAGFNPPAGSTLVGTQSEFGIKYQLYQEPTDGTLNWWFAVQGRWIGYYPGNLFEGNQSLFSGLANGGEYIGFWGEVYSALQDPTKTHDQMDSGQLAEGGWTYACYMRNLRNQQRNMEGNMTDHNGFGSVDAPNTAMYDIDMHMNSGTDWGSYFFGGGPGAP